MTPRSRGSRGGIGLSMAAGAPRSDVAYRMRRKGRRRAVVTAGLAILGLATALGIDATVTPAAAAGVRPLTASASSATTAASGTSFSTPHYYPAVVGDTYFNTVGM